MSMHLEVRPTGAAPAHGFDSLEWSIDPAIKTRISSSLGWGLAQFVEAAPAARDFFRIAAAAFLADVAIPKPAVSLHRDFVLQVHVENSAVWGNALGQMADLLHWLTGDAWSLQLVDIGLPSAQGQVLPATRIQLLSGGLDSLCGAIVGLRDALPTTFVGHRDASKPVRHAQNAIRDALEGSGPYDTYELFLTASADRKNHGPRSRSLMFMALGILAASASDASELWVPENGFTSVNPPLDAARGGSLTTRSTHPQTFSLVRALLAELSIGVAIVNPFEALTKGELVQIALPELFEEPWLTAAGQSFSCAKGNTQFRGGSSYHNCGLCVACVVRRGSFLGAGQMDPTLYDCIELTGTELAGLERDRRRDIISIHNAIHEGIPEDLIVASGAWPARTDFDAVFDIVRRGLEELALVPLPSP